MKRHIDYHPVACIACWPGLQVIPRPTNYVTPYVVCRGHDEMRPDSQLPREGQSWYDQCRTVGHDNAQPQGSCRTSDVIIEDLGCLNDRRFIVTILRQVCHSEA